MKLTTALVNVQTAPPAPASRIAQVGEALGVPLPGDLCALWSESDGVEGDMDDNVHVVVWGTDEIVSLNAAYEVSEFFPGLILVGSDGGDTGVGFLGSTERIEYVAVPLIGMGPDAILARGADLVALLSAFSASMVDE